MRPVAIDPHEPATIALGDILTGLSYALDVTEGQQRGHTARACLIGMRLASMLGLPDVAQRDLFYALLLKDAGGSSNAPYVQQLFGSGSAPPAVGLRDWRSLVREAGYSREYTHAGGSIWDRLAHMRRLSRAGREERRTLFRVRANRGARLALGLGLSEASAAAIRAADEHWDGGGDPLGLAGDAIPLLARIIGLAQAAEVFSYGASAATALEILERRRGRWFDPSLVATFRHLAGDAAFWSALWSEPVEVQVKGVEPAQVRIVVDDARLDRIADAFASLIDAKSPYTSDHSRRVAHLAAAIGERLGFGGRALTRLRRAALLHDIGKLAVPSHILEKAGPLTREEWGLIRQHPAHTLQILQAVPGFRGFAFDAACHHERLDGRGYPLGYGAAHLSRTARVLAVADMADALLADRPYRPAIDPVDALRILHADCLDGRICPDSVEAITDYVTQRLGSEGRSTPAAYPDHFGALAS